MDVSGEQGQGNFSLTTNRPGPTFATLIRIAPCDFSQSIADGTYGTHTTSPFIF